MLLRITLVRHLKMWIKNKQTTKKNWKKNCWKTEKNPLFPLISDTKAEAQSYWKEEDVAADEAFSTYLTSPWCWHAELFSLSCEKPLSPSLFLPSLCPFTAVYITLMLWSSYSNTQLRKYCSCSWRLTVVFNKPVSVLRPRPWTVGLSHTPPMSINCYRGECDIITVRYIPTDHLWTRVPQHFQLENWLFFLLPMTHFSQTHSSTSPPGIGLALACTQQATFNDYHLH